MAENDVPIKVDEDAAARVKELGFEREFEQMLEYARGMRGARGVRVTLEYDPACTHSEPAVVIWAHHDVPPEGPAADPTNWDMSAWRVATFPPKVCVELSMIAVYGPTDER
jgi:hypothetical protein